jgi:hypothetical protein
LGAMHRIDHSSAKVYRPALRLSRPVVRSAELRTNVVTAARTAFFFGSHSGLGHLLGEIGLPIEPAPEEELNLFARIALPRIERLVDAISSDPDEGETRRAIRSLIGLGPGLTPSSDDVLAGLVVFLGLYSLNTHRMGRVHDIVARGIRAEVEGRTTLVSREFLRQAAVTACNESVMKLCSAILTDGSARVERETKGVLKLGETSGTDTVLGVVLGASICAGSRANPSGRS